MNRYPLWKYLTVLAALLIGILYTLPNFFGESPAVQIAANKATVKIDNSVLERVQGILAKDDIPTTGAYFQQNGPNGPRTEARRVGQAWVRTCRSRWSQ